MSTKPAAITVDPYVIDVLLRDLVGHDKRPGAFLVYLYLYTSSSREGWQPVAASLRTIAEATGLAKSAVQLAVTVLVRRRLISRASAHPTAVPTYEVRRPWRD